MTARRSRRRPGHTFAPASFCSRYPFIAGASCRPRAIIWNRAGRSTASVSEERARDARPGNIRRNFVFFKTYSIPSGANRLAYAGSAPVERDIVVFDPPIEAKIHSSNA